MALHGTWGGDIAGRREETGEHRVSVREKPSQRVVDLLCHILSFHEEGAAADGDFSMSVEDFRGSFVRPFIEYVKKSLGACFAYFYGNPY